MEFAEYQAAAGRVDIRKSDMSREAVGFYLHGLSGEVGSLAAEYKKLLETARATRVRRPGHGGARRLSLVPDVHCEPSELGARGCRRGKPAED